MDGKPQYVNPMDINLNYSEDDNPLALKSDFILSLCELVIGGKEGLQPVEKTVIDRAVRNVYRPFLADPDPEKMPILGDLYDELLKQTEPEAARKGIRMPPYCWRITLTPWPSPRAWATPMPASRCAYTPTRCAAAMKMQRRPRKACLIAPSWGKNWGIKKNSGVPFPARRLRSAPVRDAFFSPKLPQFSPNSLIARWKSRVFDAL